MPLAERRAIVVEGSERLQLNNVIVEKDFWVCWILSLLFGRADWRETFVFKGGTALSKVFGISGAFQKTLICLSHRQRSEFQKAKSTGPEVGASATNG